MAALIEAGISVGQAAEAVKVGDPWAPPSPKQAEPSPSPLVGELVEAARKLDGEQVDILLIEASQGLGWGDALESVVLPALRQVGDEWTAGRFTPAQKHLLSEALRLRLHVAVAETGRNGAGPLVVMACPDDERHDLGLASLRLLLRQAGVSVGYLGADVPSAALIQAVEQLQPQAVVLSGVAGPSEPAIALVARELFHCKWRGQVFFGGTAVHQTAALGLPGELLPERLTDAAALIRTHLEARG